MPNHFAAAYAAIALDRKIAAHVERAMKMRDAMNAETNAIMRALLTRDLKKMMKTIEKLRAKSGPAAGPAEEHEEAEDPTNPSDVLSGAK